MDAFVDPVEDGSVPFHRLAIRRYAIDGMPTVAVGLPRHGRIGTDALQLDVIGSRSLRCERIVARALHQLTGVEDRRECPASVRSGYLSDFLRSALSDDIPAS